MVMLFALATQGAARAGSGPAKISCRSKDPRKAAVTLEGLVPGSEETLELALSDGASSLRMTDADADVYRIEALEQGVFSIIVKRRDVAGTLSLYAIPKTVKARKKTHRTHATFDAVIDAPDPKHQGPVRSADDMLRGLELSCTYHYEI
jgi:hypothetical protein